MTRIRSLDQIDSRMLVRYRNDPAAFIEECLISPYDGEPYKLNASERAFIALAFQRDDDGRLKYPLLVYSAIKKSRKTEFSALFTIALLLLLGDRYAEGFFVANDEAQAINRGFTACCRICEASPLLVSETEIYQDKILFPATQSQISAIPSNYAGQAGGHPTVSVFSELWGFSTPRFSRLWDELVPVPTRKISCRLVETHAGFEGEGQLLHSIYQRGLQLPEVGTDLRAGDGMLFFWSHSPICPWQTAKWFQQMRRELPVNQYLRMIENRFVTSEASFIGGDMAKWDRCVDHSLGHVPPDVTLPVWVGVDASFKFDQTAIVAVTFNSSRQQVRLVTHRVYQPTPDRTLDFEATIEATLKDLARRFNVRKILFDPWQMQSTAQRLLKAGLPIEEFPQSSPNLTAASQNLFDLIQSQSIVLYPDQQLRLAVSRAIAVETPRGWRISKQSAAFKIDVVVALAMACHAAVQGQDASSYTLAPFDPGFIDLDADPAAAPPPTAAQRASENAASYIRAFCAANGLLV
jgi:hypothetical protein